MTAAARLTFLSPQVLRGIRLTPRSTAGFARHRGTFARRRGKAIEPQLLKADPTLSLNTSHPLISDSAIRPQPETSTETQEQSQSTPDKSVSTHETQQQQGIASTNSPQNKENETAEEERARVAREEAKQSGPLEAVLHMQPPETKTKTKTTRPGPAMCPPPYVHHFDSYSLVKHLQEGGWSQEQATTSMKAIRTLLAENLEIAQSTLVSKSDVENVGHLSTTISVTNTNDKY
jgi:hypothetical protein